MAYTDGGLARIAAYNHKLHAFSQMVGEGTHYLSLLRLSVFLLALELGSALFDTAKFHKFPSPMCLPCDFLSSQQSPQGLYFAPPGQEYEIKIIS
jgi:hypothetical protein